MNEFARRRRGFQQEMPSSSRPYFFKTCAGPGETTYPERGSGDDAPSVYYARMLAGVTFPQTPGPQYLTYTETSFYAHIFNLEAGNYIEEESVVLAWLLGDRWYTIDKVKSRSVVSATRQSLVYTYDSSGHLLWTFDVATLNPGDHAAALQCRWSSDRCLYVEHIHSETGDNVGPHLVGVVKLDSSGSVLWNRELGATSLAGYSALTTNLLTACGRGIAFDGDGVPYVAHHHLAADGAWLSKLDPEDGATLQSYSATTTTPLGGDPALAFSMLSGFDIDQNGKLWLAFSGATPSAYVGVTRLDPASGNVELRHPIGALSVQGVRCAGEKLYVATQARIFGAGDGVSYPHACPLAGEETFLWKFSGIDEAALTQEGFVDPCHQMGNGAIVTGEIASTSHLPAHARGLDVRGNDVAVGTGLLTITDSGSALHRYAEHLVDGSILFGDGSMAAIWSRSVPPGPGINPAYSAATSCAFDPYDLSNNGPLYFGRAPLGAGEGTEALARVAPGGGNVLWSALPSEWEGIGDTRAWFVCGLSAGRV